MNQVCVSLDLETTGLKLGREEIIEIAAVKFRGDRQLGRWETLVRPRGEIPYRTQLLTGISGADLARAPVFREVAVQLSRFIGDCPIVGQSVPLDVQLLNREGLPLANDVYDTFDLASILVPQLPDYSLATVAANFKIDYPVRHRAMPDAIVARDVFLALYDLAMELDLPILTEVERLASSISWPLRHFFRDVAKAKSKLYFSTSVGAQLAAKMSLDELNMDFMVHGSSKKEAPTYRKEPSALDVAEVAALLEPNGAAASVFPGYEHRREQIHMLRAVAEALNDGTHLVVEAGTGTGKSLAYLLPAAVWAMENNRRVLISTNTINLQEQLFAKDVPDVERILSARHGPGSRRRQTAGALRAVVVKGRSNYVCLRRWNMLRRTGSLTQDEVKVLIRILVWLRQTDTGDRSELNLSPGELQVWSRVSAEQLGCTVERCLYGRRGTCLLQRTRAAAAQAHLIIVNHALMLADLANGSKILPEYDEAVIDEAHHLEDEATRQWGHEIARQSFESVLDRVFRRLDGERRTGLLAGFQGALQRISVPAEARRRVNDEIGLAQTAAESVHSELDELFSVIGRLLEESRGGSAEYDYRMRLTDAVRRRTRWIDVEGAWRELSNAMRALEERLAGLAEFFSDCTRSSDQELDDMLVEAETLRSTSAELRSLVDEITVHPRPNAVYWIAAPGRGSPMLCIAPLSVAESMQETLFGQKRAVVLAGATLSTEGNFSFLKGSLGLQEPSEMIVGSPFHYERSTLVCIVEDIPEPNKPGYQRAVDNALAEIVSAAQGRTLALYTSRSALNASVSAVRARLESAGILVLAHGIDGSRRQLLSTFKSNARALLVGTNSFWEGIDIVGDSLSVVVIAKLPFGVPTDPVFAARSELFQDGFNEYAVPRAILRFKQGFGRLIRSQSDRGVVVLLDRRLATKQYGQSFQDSLPPCTVAIEPAQKVPGMIAEWLSQCADPEDQNRS
ncbi:MAG: DEAD/DEAH box helicase [Chloroflexota bacterium]|nr:MAG: DEAD/DEAH box helicase [Chloroflexota bacterium]